MTKAPMLALRDFTKPFVLQTDVSTSGIGADLLQEWHPISYFTNEFCTKLQNLSTCVREYMQLLLMFKSGRDICLGGNSPQKLIQKV